MEKDNVIAIMAAIIFTDIRSQKPTQKEAIEASANIAVSLYNNVYNIHFIKKP